MNCRHRLARHVRRWIARWRIVAWDVTTDADCDEFEVLSLETVYVSIIVKPGMKPKLHPRLRIKPLNDKGEALPLPEPPTWTIDDPKLASLRPSADGLSCVVIEADPFPEGTVKVTATFGSMVPAMWTITYPPQDATHFEASDEMVPDDEPAPAPEAPTGDHQVVS